MLQTDSLKQQKLTSHILEAGNLRRGFQRGQVLRGSFPSLQTVAS